MVRLRCGYDYIYYWKTQKNVWIGINKGRHKQQSRFSETTYLPHKTRNHKTVQNTL